MNGNTAKNPSMSLKRPGAQKMYYRKDGLYGESLRRSDDRSLNSADTMKSALLFLKIPDYSSGV